MYTNTNGYQMISTPKGLRYVHRLVMARHLGRNLRPNEVVIHKDGNKLNNHISNLELKNKGEHLSKQKTGTHINVGGKHGMAKMTEEKVLEARRLRKAHQKTQKEIADMFGISVSQMGRILNGERWTHVPL